jgi:Ca2+-binding RTX toxin-like protein
VTDYVISGASGPMVSGTEASDVFRFNNSGGPITAVIVQAFGDADRLVARDDLNGFPEVFTLINSILYGGEGNDIIDFMAFVEAPALSGNLFSGGPGDDQILSGDELFTWPDSINITNNTFDGDAGNDTVFIHGGDNALQGGHGNDDLTAYGDFNMLDGGDGDDVLRVRSMSFVFETHVNTLNGGAGNDRLDAFDSFGTNLLGGEGDDTLIVFGSWNMLSGGDGDDTLIAGDKTGFQTLLGGSGDDYLKAVTVGGDLFDGGEGNDTLEMATVIPNTVVFKAGYGHDSVIGFKVGVDRISIGGLLSAVQVIQDGTDILIKLPGGDDVLTLRDVGSAALEEVDISAGDDLYLVDDPLDLVVETGGGIDTVIATINYNLTPNVERLILEGPAAESLQGYGNNLANVLVGHEGADLLSGKEGADWMVGDQGDDAYFVDNAGDVVTENAGEGIDAVYASIHYRLTENVENLVLQGTDDLQGYGNGLANAIFGNSGE